jgi:hypothetical protein
MARALGNTSFRRAQQPAQQPEPQQSQPQQSQPQQSQQGAGAWAEGENESEDAASSSAPAIESNVVMGSSLGSMKSNA